jgi:hypothetical protein
MDQAFAFTENVLEKQYGLDSTMSCIAIVLLLVLASYVPMILLS